MARKQATTTGRSNDLDKSRENVKWSLIPQVALLDYDRPQRQTIEAGWKECHQIDGDRLLHLFLFYTTKVRRRAASTSAATTRMSTAGFSTIHPGAVFTPTSVIGGQQYRMGIKFELYQANWWFW